MKGVVFTEFYEFVETQYSPVVLQKIINGAELQSEGVYTATGTYPFCEMGALVGSAMKESGLPAATLLKAFGRHLFTYFSTTNPQHFEGVTNTFDFLHVVENHIHVDVRKLYPDAELPTFEIIEHTEKRFVMIYKSSRGLGDLCEGLIEGCMEFFEETGTISQELLSKDPVTHVKFVLELL